MLGQLAEVLRETPPITGGEECEAVVERLLTGDEETLRVVWADPCAYWWTRRWPRLRSIELAGEPAEMQTLFVGGLKRLPIAYELA